MTLRLRKMAELSEQLRGVESDFAHWSGETAEGSPLCKHHNQMGRLTEQLRGMTGRIDEELRAIAQDGDDVLRQCRRLQKRILEVHRIWDYFRSKFGQRYVSWYQGYLDAAGEFAWLCYEPAVHLKKAQPLVFMNGDFSPFMLDRSSHFSPERAEGEQSPLYLRFVAALPVPVIGLPWYQVAHLADMVLIAHEVGHALWTDLGLEGDADAHLVAAAKSSALPRDRREAWTRWLPEVFADLYAVHVAGPAYVAALADLLAEAPDAVEAEFSAPPENAAHPPASLRIAIATKALERNGFTEEAAAANRAWHEQYTVDGSHLTDVDPIVTALTDGTYEGFQKQSMRERVRFDKALHDKAANTATGLVKGQPTKMSDVRALVAAARLAFDLAPGNTAPQRAVIARITELLDADTRRRRTPMRGRARPVAKTDLAAGAALYDLFDELEEDR